MDQLHELGRRYRWLGWGRDYRRHLAKGMDHGAAAYLADRAFERRALRMHHVTIGGGLTWDGVGVGRSGKID